MDILYTAEATSRGSGRDGEVTSSDGVIDEQVRMPQALGGDGKGTNPEQLFAAGYAACFHSALRMAAKGKGVQVPAEGTVTAQVGIGPEGESMGLAVTLVGDFPGLDRAAADDLMETAHRLCPYSKATRGNIEVTLRTTG